MKKYLQVIKVTFKEYFVYRLNFILWRFRSVCLLLIIYFLWQTAIPEGQVVFGYDQAMILTYVLGSALVRSFVLSSRSGDVTGQITSGEITNYLLKPFNYLKYWLAKDFVDKILNLFFSIFEITIIISIFRPPLIFQQNINLLLTSIILVALAIILNFFLSFLLSLAAFWTPENPWPLRFLFNILGEFFAGGLFPLDILPSAIFNFLRLLPFPYLLFFPLNVYLGKVSFEDIAFGILIMILWIVSLYYFSLMFFKKGLKTYSAWGR